MLRSSVERVYRESQSLGDYEGRSGVSPREVRTLLLDAAQSADYACLSPFAVLTQLDELCKRSSEYEWLREKPVAGDFHDHRAFREVVRARLLDSIEDELRTATGIVEQTQTTELFDRYVHHVGAWVKGEKLRNPHTNRSEPPDERMMKEVERLIGVIAKQEDYRRTLISMVAAWAIDHPGAPIVNAVVFEEPLRKLRDAVFAQRRGAVAQTVRDLVGLLRAGSERRAADDLREDRRRAAQTALERLKGLGYCERCAGDAADALLRARFADVAT